MNRHCTLIDSSGHRAESQNGERVLDAQFANGLVHQNVGTILQQDAVVIPVAPGRHPAEPKELSVTNRQNCESRNPFRDWNRGNRGGVNGQQRTRRDPDL